MGTNNIYRIVNVIINGAILDKNVILPFSVHGSAMQGAKRTVPPSAMSFAKQNNINILK